MVHICLSYDKSTSAPLSKGRISPYPYPTFTTTIQPTISGPPNETSHLARIIGSSTVSSNTDLRSAEVFNTDLRSAEVFLPVALMPFFGRKNTRVQIISRNDEHKTNSCSICICTTQGLDVSPIWMLKINSSERRIPLSQGWPSHSQNQKHPTQTAWWLFTL